MNSIEGIVADVRRNTREHGVLRALRLFNLRADDAARVAPTSQFEVSDYRLVEVWPVIKSASLLALAISGGALVASSATTQPGLELDHVWLMVSPDAPEREVLTRAGFQISPDTNRHDGQGTASMTVEFENAYLELMWPDSTVTVEPDLERAAEKFRQRMLWRTSGWCPIGVGFRRTGASNDPWPFPTWSWSAEWMPKGSVMEMLTPRDDTRSPALFIEPWVLTDTAEQAARGSRYRHSLGVHRVSAIRLISPRSYQPIASLGYLRERHLLTLATGDQWIIEMTFDEGAAGQSKDLRPDLPLVVRH